MDHLISAAAGGSNGVANRVLSCASCNGDEKRDMPWEEYLRRKVADDVIFDERRELIRRWTELPSPASVREFDPELLERATKLAIKAFDDAVILLRDSRIARP